MDRGAWWAIVHGLAKESDMLNDKSRICRDVVNFEIPVLNVCTVDHITFFCLLCIMHPFVFQCLCWLPLVIRKTDKDKVL